VEGGVACNDMEPQRVEVERRHVAPVERTWYPPRHPGGAFGRTQAEVDVLYEGSVRILGIGADGTG
jgi:hypothetical protein